MKVSAVIPVAGSGLRFAGTMPKQFMDLGGRPLLAVTLQKMLDLDQIGRVVVVCAPDARERVEKMTASLPGFTEKGMITNGGKERQDSVFNGLSAVKPGTDIVLVHDGVRPLITSDILLKSIQVAQEHGACVAAVPVKDTIKRVHNNQVIETLPREELWQIQTPQTSRFDWLWQAHLAAREKNFYSTDEAALLEWSGHPVQIIPGDYNNIKITTPEDLKIARLLIEESLS